MTMDSLELRRRVEQFASLQAAHRALAHSVHPAELAAVRDQSRDLLIQLQNLTSRSRSEGPDGDEADPAVSLGSVDRALTEQTQRTLEVLERIEITQLRASIPPLSLEYPEEVRGLIDVLLAGDRVNDQHVRILEYLITMLSTQQKGGRRVVIQEPSEVTRRLHEIAHQLLETTDGEFVVAERVLEEATTEVLQQGEIGEIRDRVRRYKEDLAGGLLHPRVLAAAVAYNVAMWNRVAGEIDSSRSIEQLAEGLFFSDKDQPESNVSDAACVQALDSTVLERLVSALGARIAGQTSRDEEAQRVVGAFGLDSLRPEDAEIFADEQADEATMLMRSAITLGLILKHRGQTEEALATLGVDIELLASAGVEDLMARMTELAHKRFAASNYGDAFRLSDIKTHSLAEHAAAARSASSSAAPSRQTMNDMRAAGDEGRQSNPWATRLMQMLPSALVMLVLGLIVAVFAIPPLASRDSAKPERAELTQISPFLEAGRVTEAHGSRSFTGRVGPTWEYLGNDERREVATHIGRHFEAQGIERIVLMDPDRVIVAEYLDGKLLALLPRSSGAEPGDSESRRF